MKGLILKKLFIKISIVLCIAFIADLMFARSTNGNIEDILLYTSLLFFSIPVFDLLTSHGLTKFIYRKSADNSMFKCTRIFLICLSVAVALIILSYFFKTLGSA